MTNVVRPPTVIWTVLKHTVLCSQQQFDSCSRPRGTISHPSIKTVSKWTVHSAPSPFHNKKFMHLWRVHFVWGDVEGEVRGKSLCPMLWEANLLLRYSIWYPVSGTVSYLLLISFSSDCLVRCTMHTVTTVSLRNVSCRLKPVVTTTDTSVHSLILRCKSLYLLPIVYFTDCTLAYRSRV